MEWFRDAPTKRRTNTPQVFIETHKDASSSHRDVQRRLKWRPKDALYAWFGSFSPKETRNLLELFLASEKACCWIQLNKAWYKGWFRDAPTKKTHIYAPSSHRNSQRRPPSDAPNDTSKCFFLGIYFYMFCNTEMQNKSVSFSHSQLFDNWEKPIYVPFYFYKTNFYSVYGIW